MKVNYKIRQLNEEWKTFNDRVTRMNVSYEVDFYVPSWLELDAISSSNETFDGLDCDGLKMLDDGRTLYKYKLKVSSVSKCDLTKDKFDEEIGVYICETRAEIKVLEKVRKVIEVLYSIVYKNNNKEQLDNMILERLEKNNWNLIRLEGNIKED